MCILVVIDSDRSPANPIFSVKFEIDDAESQWTYPDNSFDFVYARYMLGSIADWPKLIGQAYQLVLHPFPDDIVRF